MPVVRNPQYYFKEGFCWTDVNSTYLKARIKNKGVFDVLSMSLFTQVNIPDWYFVCLINTRLISFYVDNFINNTSHFQINDARQLPIIIPSQIEIEYLENLVKNAIRIKQNGSENLTELMYKIECEIDTYIEKLYRI